MRITGPINSRNAVSVTDSCLIFRETLVIAPSSQHFHFNHSETGRMKSIVCGHARWRGKDKDVEVLVKECFACQMYRRGPTKENGTPWPKTKKIMESRACRF